MGSTAVVTVRDVAEGFPGAAVSCPTCVCPNTCSSEEIPLYHSYKAGPRIYFLSFW